jgi:surface protein
MFHTSTSFNTDIGAWNVASVVTFMYAVVRRRAPP